MSSLLVAVDTADVWIAYFDPVVGHEEGGRRLAVIISSSHLHVIPSDLVFVVPVTSTNLGVRSHVRVHLSEGNLSRPSFAMSEQIRSVSRQRLRKRIGTVGQETLALIRERILLFMDLD